MARNPRKQSKGSHRALKVVLIGGMAGLALLVVGLLVAKSMVNDWLRGEGFRSWVLRRAAVALRSEVDLAPLDWDGSRVYTERFEAKGRRAAAFSELGLHGVRARAGGVADKALRVPEISVNRLDLKFSPHRVATEAPAEPDASVQVAQPTPPRKLPEWLSQRLPDRVEVDEVLIESTRVSVAKEAGEVFLLSGTKTTLRPEGGMGGWEIDGVGGKIALPGQPEIALRDLGLRWKGKELFVERCSLGIFEEGHIGGRGEIGFESPGHFDLALEISSIQVDDLVKGEWRDRLGGTIQGPVHITGAPGALVYEGTLNLSEGVIEGIPVLQRIARYTRSERFERLVLNEARADFRREGERLELRELVLQSDGLVRVEGEVDLVGQQLAGQLKVGVSPGTMRWIPGAERLVFTENREGFLWAPLVLSGTTVEPKEDLSARLLAAAGEEVIGGLPEGLLEGAKELLSPPGEGTSSSQELLDQGKKVLDLLSPFLQGR